MTDSFYTRCNVVAIPIKADKKKARRHKDHPGYEAFMLLHVKAPLREVKRDVVTKSNYMHE